MKDHPQVDQSQKAPPESLQAAPKTPRSEASFLIVGIGASAGGLEAFERFFTHMPADANMAFVVTQHLDAGHTSILSELVARFTSMPVTQVTDQLPIAPNHVYVIPPNRNLALQQGRLILSELVLKHGNPIDFFFASLAHDQGERTIGIVLSGTGSDGSRGIEDIRAAGGIVIAQEPESAAYDGMPRSAIATGIVDITLPPEEMPAELLRYSQTRDQIGVGTARQSQSVITPPLNKIFSLLYGLTHQDFSTYKQTTILRQIKRRMKVNSLHDLSQYAEYLQETPAEVQLLFNDLLIGVTHFFRDAEAFEALIKFAVLPTIQHDPNNEIPIRVWVPACSTGEEAYSIAIAFQEQLDALNTRRKVQIYATDIDPQAIHQARAGIYRSTIQSDLSEDRLQRFFTLLESNKYQVKKDIRDMVVFAVHNLLMDPPFSRINLISCRNLLIYLEPDTQQKVFPLFHYALVSGGFLFLGTAETVGDFGDFFSTLDLRNKIFFKKETVHRWSSNTGLHPPLESKTIFTPPPPEKQDSQSRLKEWAEKALLNSISSSGVVTDDKFNILYVIGHTSNYLEQPTGETTNNVVRIARDGLKPKLSNALRKALNQEAEVRFNQLNYKVNQQDHPVNVVIKPFFDAMEGKTLILIIFEDIPFLPAPKAALSADPAVTNKDQRIADLEQDLQLKDDYLLATINDLEVVNQEANLVNQDLSSANEELQSTNEELETSTEELQSVNEELVTVNTELQSKNEELSVTINDLNNFLTSTEIATVFLDLNLQIRRFTPTIHKIFNLLPGDIGRPIQHFVSNLAYKNMIADCQAVLDTLYSHPVEVQVDHGEWYLMTIIPYRTVEHRIDGLVITFFDITEQKKSEEARRLAVLLRDSNDAIIVFDFHGNIVSWNHGATQLYGWSEKESLQKNIHEFIPADKQEEMHAAIQRLASGKKVESFETERLIQNGSRVVVWVTMTVLLNDLGDTIRIATTERDITARTQQERSLRFSNRALISLHAWSNALIRHPSAQADFTQLCQILVKNAGYQMAWVGQVITNNLAADSDESVTSIAYAAHDQAQWDGKKRLLFSTKASRAWVASVLTTGKPAAIRHISTDSEQKRWQKESKKFGYASFVALPFSSQAFPSGVLIIYAAEPDSFDTQEVDLLKQFIFDLPHLENKPEKRKVIRQ